jgi:hypothetical protein
LDNKQILEQLHDDSDFFREFSQDPCIDIFDRIYPDAEIFGRDMSDSCSNCDDGQISGNVGGDDGSCGYNTKMMIIKIRLSGTKITAISR